MTKPILQRRFPALERTLPFRRLGDGPTPVRRLTGTTRDDLWCKDESGYGTGGWGGNKVRKLEWLLPEMQRRKAHTVLTVGATGTNWGLAAALYARELGIDTVLALVDQPEDEHVREQQRRLRESGATVHHTRSKLLTMAGAPWLFLRHTRGGRLPYYLPPGGSAPIGVLGYVEAGLELGEQVVAGRLPAPRHIVTAVGSGGTVAGLALGCALAGLRARVIGVVVNDTLPLATRDLTRLADRAAAVLRKRGAAFDTPQLRLTATRDYLGGGYGHPTAQAADAADTAEAAGLRLDPVYSAKAFAAALTADLEGPVLFLNTYGPRK
ncbi:MULTISPECIES: 1-aminocyclopropane-1-carboxylate deaminase/D-cysteine desulfhydrase [Streptomyces]|uniref:Pyridoxal-phosphate dependent enzyme n=1 Tax=Streptomyces solicathayae TaxID=3081768 RepID=A0ABZ0LLZ6_9ACTN|nr:pyridoxal-phosphate dependent enzyme [Streptomyces sp. HUAS YS2]WOX20509.1 pyridoxal-phosphate dependent enzyme [Streptomyces sp. HUAS YS2]